MIIYEWKDNVMHGINEYANGYLWKATANSRYVIFSGSSKSLFIMFNFVWYVFIHINGNINLYIYIYVYKFNF